MRWTITSIDDNTVMVHHPLYKGSSGKMTLPVMEEDFEVIRYSES